MTSTFKIIKQKQSHQKFDEKDFTIAFIMVYKELNSLLANEFIKKEICKENIAWAISDIIINFADEDDHKKIKHFLLSLLFQTEVYKKNKNDGRSITFVSENSLKNFNMIELIQLATETVDAMRHLDGFLNFLEGATVKRYESMQQIIAKIYNSDKKTFEEIILELGFAKK